ncbi:DUF742 domain-containing protein [Nocardia sp. NBC_01730]|uniref:DUF742 domain-containing protein n=1 Tax=Nocardia sp. NBC_01730 TaxID=2975998 RepID=UPI002E0F59A1|nr:DUF742 domain-containing protein [Nocardia sp. NBC_01730]
MTYDDGSWFDEDPGPLVRPFAVTRGRAGRDMHNLDIITLVVAIRPETEAATLDREYGDILRMCQGRPLTIAEIAAGLNLLLAAVKVLVSDLISSGHLIFRSPTKSVDRPDVQLLQAVLDGVRNI